MAHSEPAVFNPFPGDSYDTPEEIKPDFTDYLLFRSRLSCYLPVFYNYIKAGYYGARGKLDADCQIRTSLVNVRVIEHLGTRVHLSGLNNLDSDPRPAVIISNHMSLLETAVFHAFLRPRRDFCFIVKNQLFSIPYFRHILLSMKCVGVTRENPRDDFRVVLEKGKERLDAGVSVIVFPQASRMVEFDRANFNTLGIKLARAAGVPVIPCALRTDFVGNGSIIKDLGPIHRDRPVHFAFGAPIEVTGNGKEAHEAVTDFIVSHLREWGCSVKE